MAVAAFVAFLMLGALLIVVAGYVATQLEAEHADEVTSPVQQFVALGEIDHGFRPIGEVAAPTQPRQRCRICAGARHQGACE